MDQFVREYAFEARAALAIVLLTCIGFSVWLCLRLRKDEDGTWSEMKEKWKRQRFRKQLTKQFESQVKAIKARGKPVLDVERGCDTDSEAENACSICLDGFDPIDLSLMIGYLPTCGHYFHFECVWPWLETQKNCPICRKDIILNEKDVSCVPFQYIAEKLQSGAISGQTNLAFEGCQVVTAKPVGIFHTAASGSFLSGDPQRDVPNVAVYHDLPPVE